MKKKFKTHLVGELIAIFIISLILTTISISITFKSLNISAFSINKILFPKHYDKDYIIGRYKRFVGDNVEKIIKGNIKDIKVPHKMDTILKEEIPYSFNGKTLVFIVNSKGEILNSNIDKDLYSIKNFKINEGLQLKRYDSMSINIKETKKISDDLFMIILNDTVIDGEIIIIYIGIVIFMIIATILAKGRLKYIIDIEKGVNKLYESDFQETVALKYNNELTSLAISLNDMATKIKENKKNEEEFLLNISHDLRTPLTSILGFLNLLKNKRYEKSEEKEKYINIVEEQCLYLKTLIEEFFEFSKLKWKNVKLNKDNIKLQEFIRQISDGFYPQLKEYNIKLIMNFTKEPLYIQIDIDKFMRVIENLFSNAIKYSKEDTEIILNLYKHKQIILIEFWNTPKEDINKEELNFLFERFYKKDSSRGSKGAGLGLAIALEIIKLHKGSMEAKIEDEKLGIIIKL